MQESVRGQRDLSSEKPSANTHTHTHSSTCASTHTHKHTKSSQIKPRHALHFSLISADLSAGVMSESLPDIISTIKQEIKSLHHSAAGF